MKLLWERLIRDRGLAAVVLVTVVAMFCGYVSTNQIFPDTQYYIGWTYRLMGLSAEESQRLTLEYISAGGVFKPYDYLWGSPLELSTKPRLLVPLLSIPFVMLFGPDGIVVVPGLAFVAAIVVIYRFACRFADPVAAAVATCLPLLSMLVLRWGIGGLTDSMALLLHALMLHLLPWRRVATWKTAAALGTLCALAAAARIISPFTIAVVAAVWLWAWRNNQDRRSWTVAAIGAALGTVAGAIWTKVLSAGLTAQMYYYIMTNGQISGLRDLPRWYREVGVGFIGMELEYIAGSPPLVVLLLLSFSACWVGRRTVIPWLVLSGWVGAAGLFLINPAPTEFRYELPMLPAMVAGAAVLIGHLIGRREPQPLRVIQQREHLPPGSQVRDRVSDLAPHGVASP